MVHSLDQKDLEKEMAIHSSIFAWRITRIEEHGELQSMGLKRVGDDWTNEHTILINPSFQYFIHRSIVVWVHKQKLLKIPGFDSTVPRHLVAIICHICAVIHHFMRNRKGKGGNSENLFLSSKITVDDDCSHKIKKHLLRGRKGLSVIKSRDTTLMTKVHIVKAMLFHVWMESWNIKKAECQRTDAFKMWCCRRLLRVLWTARRSNQSFQTKSVLNIHWKDCCWSWNSNTLATWCEELTPWKRHWCWERLRIK